MTDNQDVKETQTEPEDTQEIYFIKVMLKDTRIILNDLSYIKNKIAELEKKKQSWFWWW